MKKALDFQSIMMTLQDFWAERDCLIWQPYYSQVGAGTMNPATFLRVLGPEPWKVAYVEPSIRPDDGRYGDNPNRLQQFYQFQVILKPDPGNPQEIYLNSLKALGIDPAEHDIRFVEDNWQQPAIGAWGLGWEVWLDGQEITQFTYFQQCGGLELDPVSVEITYGLERIAMVLQGVRHFKDIQWSPERTYGDVNLMGEREHSAYYFDLADVEGMRTLYDIYEKEAVRAIESGLVLPAHDYVLKTSHTFNILDTRGAVGVTERQELFGRTRDLARRVAETYVAQREEAEYPWMTDEKDEGTVAAAVEPKDITAVTAPFLLEIGTEELPTGDLANALTQLEKAIPSLLDNLRLAHGEIEILGTPRRLVVSVKDLATRQPDQNLEVKGPPASRAFDADGNPTKAAEGFARSKGIDASNLVVETIDGGEYVVAKVEQLGQPAMAVLSEALTDLVAGIKFGKSMRWNESGVSFSRPIRWLMALLDGQVVPFAYTGYQSGRETRGLRFVDPEHFDVSSPEDYFKKMAAQGIILDPAARKAAILEQAVAIAESVGGHVPEDAGLLEEVTGLVEAPTAFLGKFDASYLDVLPPEVLVSVMRKHQRYFVVEDAQGNLMHYFIGVRNGNADHIEIVADGNEQVILARFADARFFVEKDLKKPLAEFIPELKTLTFQRNLGSFYDKTERISALAEALMLDFDLTDEEKVTTQRAALLCKADLVTNMVVEMTSLQGIMGRYYALNSGETQPVADAIFEHYLPRSADDALPKAKPGLVIGIADRLDSLMGLFSIDLAPTGTKDPYGQRRAALGICQNLIAWEMSFDLKHGLAEARKVMTVDVSDENEAACLEFIQGRLRVMLLDMGFNYDVVDAVLAEKGEDPFSALVAIQQLAEAVAQENWSEILPAFSRCVRITRDLDEVYAVDETCLEEPTEKGLLKALEKAEADLAGVDTVAAFMAAFVPMVPAINSFFDAVLVMAEDEKVRKTRLALLQRVAALSKGIADLSFLEGF